METEHTRPAKTRGRPSLYRPEFARLARNYCEMGAIDDQLAHFFDVTLRTVKAWRVSKPDFAEGCRVGKEIADENVERMLYNRAVGYSFDAEKILTSGGTVFRVAYVEHLPPDVKACIVWLTNRRSGEWRTNPKRDETNGSNGGDLLEQIRADAPTLTADEPGPAAPILQRQRRPLSS